MEEGLRRGEGHIEHAKQGDETRVHHVATTTSLHTNTQQIMLLSHKLHCIL